MSAATLTQRRPVAFVPGDDGAPILVRDTRQTLDDLIVGAWEGLSAHRSVECPICRGAVRPRYGAGGHAPVGGRCDDCDSTIS
jgi:hypothetical protein